MKPRVRKGKTGALAAVCLAAIYTVLSGSVPVALPSDDPPTRAVFSGLAAGGSWDLWLASADGRFLKRAAETPGVDERTPVLSPDRKYVAYSTSRGDIRLYNLYDRAERILQLPRTGRPSWPAWGPDAQSLYYVNVQMGKGPDEGQVWRYDLESGKASEVADEPEVEGWPAVNGQGVLLFTTWTQSQACHLSRMKPHNKTPKLLWDQSLTLSGAALLSRGRVAAIAGDGRSQKVIILGNDGKLQREYDVAGASGRPVSFQDGLLMTRIVEGRASIHVLDLSTGKTRPWTGAAPRELIQMRDPDYR